MKGAISKIFRGRVVDPRFYSLRSQSGLSVFSIVLLEGPWMWSLDDGKESIDPTLVISILPDPWNHSIHYRQSWKHSLQAWSKYLGQVIEVHHFGLWLRAPPTSLFLCCLNQTPFDLPNISLWNQRWKTDAWIRHSQCGRNARLHPHHVYTVDNVHLISRALSVTCIVTCSSLFS